MMGTDADDKKDDHKDDADDKDDDKKGDGKDPASDSSDTSGGGSSGLDMDEIRKAIREEVKSILGDEDARSHVRRGDIEAQAERMVREATEKLTREKQHDEDHQKLRSGNDDGDKDKKPPSEDSPKKSPRLRKALWGAE
jgi:hypothetical protein